MNIAQVKKDFDNGVLISRATLGALIDYAMGLQVVSGSAPDLTDKELAAMVEPVGDPVDYRVAEFWSSARPGTKVRMLAEGADIEQWCKRSDFIRWVR